MFKLQFSYLVAVVILIVFCSCSGGNQSHYVNQLKENLSAYDSITLSLISKYSKHSITNTTTVYPSEVPKNGDNNRVYDTSINLFCKQNNINYIEVQTDRSRDENHKPGVTYYLLDNNYQYIFNDKGQTRTASFENTRVRIVPINNKWTFQYEKPNF